MKYCEDCGSELKDGVCPKCGNGMEEKNSSPKKKSKIGIYILVAIVLAAGVYIGYNYALKEKEDNKPKTGIVDTWEVTYLYEDDTTYTKKLYFNSDNSFKSVFSSSSTENTSKGTWKEVDKNEYLVTFPDDDNEYYFYIVDNDTLCYEKEKCTNAHQYYRSSSKLEKTIRVGDLEEDDEDDNDEDYGDYSNAETDTKGDWTFNMKYKESRDSDKAIVYIFYGQECSHCEELFKFLNGLSEDVKDTFVVQKYETWYNASNEALMKKVSSEVDGEEATGVPYIVINNYSWTGFANSYESEILNAISKGNSRNVVKSIIE